MNPARDLLIVGGTSFLVTFLFGLAVGAVVMWRLRH